MREFSTIQEKILDRALFLIGEKGSYDVPVRDITQAAGVNVNAINYYFGSKDTMIDQMEEFFINNYLLIYSILDKDMEDEKKLLVWANEVMEYTLHYPGIQVVLRYNVKARHAGKMKAFLEEQAYSLNKKVDETLKTVFHVEGDDLYPVRVLFESAILHPASFGTEINFDTAKIKDKDFRTRYLTFTIETIKKGIDRHEV